MKQYTMSQYATKEDLYADMKKDIRALEKKVDKLNIALDFALSQLVISKETGERIRRMAK